MTDKQGVVAVTWRFFHPGKQTLKISQGTIREDEYTLNILCLHKTRSVSSVCSALVFFFLCNLLSLLLFHFSVFEFFITVLRVET